MKYVKTTAVIVAALAVVLGAKHYLGTAARPVRQFTGRESTVVTAEVGQRPFATRMEAIGTACANESVTITALVTERISRILFADGAAVRAGDLLVQLEDAEEQADVEEARVALDQERRELDRTKALREKQMVSEQELDSRQSAAEAAGARLAAAEARLRDRAITAPFPGVLGIRRVSPGALVGPGTVITTLDDIEIIKVDFAVPETLLREVKLGLTVEAASAAWPGETFAGTVASVDSRVNPATRAVTVQAHIPNPGHRLRPGMLLTVVLIGTPRTAVCLPEKALLAYGDQHYAFVLKPDSTVVRREVHLGQREIGWVEIRDGVTAGETVVVEGLMELKDGARVRVAGGPATTSRPQSQA